MDGSPPTIKRGRWENYFLVTVGPPWLVESTWAVCRGLGGWIERQTRRRKVRDKLAAVDSPPLQGSVQPAIAPRDESKRV
ncbi:hypothetical protein GGTG_07978 [Gaeumannomyces tritici R3-111a-1]|uniref:Uncharacterized protein n=1 Tax=Gaeumannomyces tritici (strain R3-111a-1) TaxID=644352 RepID=J3P389_GAET3|nr:hypothetical protein GGTG_07978 [Gaeumannomyces tritici R3-111a-1]EJT74131.1 hypothetical protein GGTG_07978 [Gaeumannomyces tritici R3-111a-1]